MSRNVTLERLEINIASAHVNICLYKVTVLFKAVPSSNFDLFNSYRSGRQTTLDNEALREEVEADPWQTI